MDYFIKGGYFKDNVIAVGAAVMVIEELGRDHIEEKANINSLKYLLHF